jgi:hypothetical protein
MFVPVQTLVSNQDQLEKNIYPVFSHWGRDSSDQGVTKRCRLSWLTNSALVYEPKCGGRGGVEGVSADENSCTQEPK